MNKRTMFLRVMLIMATLFPLHVLAFGGEDLYEVIERGMDEAIANASWFEDDGFYGFEVPRERQGHLRAQNRYQAPHQEPHCIIGDCTIEDHLKILSSGDQRNINGVDAIGRSRLHHAVEIGCVDLTHALVTAGADVAARDRYGLNSVQMAYNDGNFELIRILQQSSSVDQRCALCRSSSATFIAPYSDDCLQWICGDCYGAQLYQEPPRDNNDLQRSEQHNRGADNQRNARRRNARRNRNRQQAQPQSQPRQARRRPGSQPQPVQQPQQGRRRAVRPQPKPVRPQPVPSRPQPQLQPQQNQAPRRQQNYRPQERLNQLPREFDREPIYYVYTHQHNGWSCGYHALFAACKVEQALGKGNRHSNWNQFTQFTLPFVHQTGLRPSDASQSNFLEEHSQRLDLDSFLYLNYIDGAIRPQIHDKVYIRWAGRISKAQEAQMFKNEYRRREAELTREIQDKLNGHSEPFCVHCVCHVTQRGIDHAVLVSVVQHAPNERSMYIYDNCNEPITRGSEMYNHIVNIRNLFNVLI